MTSAARAAPVERQRGNRQRRERQQPAQARGGAHGGASADLRRGALGGVVELEEGALRKAADAGDQIAREGLHQHVLIAHGAVVIAPRHLQFVFQIAEIALQLEEIAAGFQIGIILRQREQPAERGRQRAFGLRALRDVALRQRLRRRAHLGHLFQHAALVRRIAFDGLHQIADEVGAALELDVDAAPGLIGHLAGAHQPVEGDGGVEHDRGGNCEENPEEHGYWSPRRGRGFDHSPLPMDRAACAALLSTIELKG